MGKKKSQNSPPLLATHKGLYSGSFISLNFCPMTINAHVLCHVTPPLPPPLIESEMDIQPKGSPFRVDQQCMR